MTKEDSIALYIQLFEELSTEYIDNIDCFVSADIYFKDPFNKISGRSAFRRLLTKLLNDVENPSFKVTHKAWSNNTIFLRWSFEGKVKGINHWNVQGMSEICFNEDGLINRHIDYWDASDQFYAKLPIIGPIIRLIRRRLMVS